jgi:hypothetical protein
MRPNFLCRNIQLLQNKLKPPSLNYHSLISINSMSSISDIFIWKVNEK